MNVIIPYNIQNGDFKGVIFVNDIIYTYKVENNTDNNSLEKASLYCSQSLVELFKNKEDLLFTKFKKSSSVHKFALELESLIRKLSLTTTANNNNTYHGTYYNLVLKHINDMGWNFVNNIDLDIKQITIHFKDICNYDHELIIQLNYDYPLSSPICISSLPSPYQFTWKESNTLNDIKDDFIKKIHQYEPFWKEMKDLDSSTLIIDPLNPTNKDIYRRILIDTQCSIYIEIDPLNPHQLSDWRIAGSETYVNKYTNQFISHYHEWNTLKSIKSNLETVLNIQLPLPGHKDILLSNAQCSICYTYALRNNEITLIPDQICKNEKCHRCFHSSCLIQWLQSNPTTKHSFNTLFGKCPYCSSPIYVNITINQ